MRHEVDGDAPALQRAPREHVRGELAGRHSDPVAGPPVEPGRQQPEPGRRVRDELDAPDVGADERGGPLAGAVDAVEVGRVVVRRPVRVAPGPPVEERAGGLARRPAQHARRRVVEVDQPLGQVELVAVGGEGHGELGNWGLGTGDWGLGTGDWEDAGRWQTSGASPTGRSRRELLGDAFSTTAIANPRSPDPRSLFEPYTSSSIRSAFSSGVSSAWNSAASSRMSSASSRSSLVGLGGVLERPLLGVDGELDDDREVVAPDVAEPADLDEGEVVRVEHVVERVPEPPVVGVERGEQAAPDAGVEEPGRPLEQRRRVAPGHVVEVAGDDDRALERGDLAGGQDELGVAERRVLAGVGARRARVEEHEPDRLAGAEPGGQEQAGHLVLDEVADPDVLEREPGVDAHPVGVVLGELDGVLVGLLEGPRRPGPPLVRLDGDDDVGVLGPDRPEPPLAVAVGHEHVRDHEPDRPAVFRPIGLGRLDRGERRVRGHPPRLVRDRRHEQREDRPLDGARLARAHVDGPEQRQRDERADGDLRAREVERADPPVRRPDERERRREDEHRAEHGEEDLDDGHG